MGSLLKVTHSSKACFVVFGFGTTCETFSYCLWGSQGKNTEVVCHSLLWRTTFGQNSPPCWVAYPAWVIVSFISHASKVMLKILQARLQQYVSQEHPDIQAGFRKGRGTRDQIANIRCIIEKAKEFQKTSTSALLTTPKPLTVWITENCGKFLKRWGYQTTLPAPEKSVCRSRSNS